MASEAKDALIAVLEEYGSPRVAVEHDADAILAHPEEVLEALMEAGRVHRWGLEWCDGWNITSDENFAEAWCYVIPLSEQSGEGAGPGPDRARPCGRVPEGEGA